MEKSFEELRTVKINEIKKINEELKNELTGITEYQVGIDGYGDTFKIYTGLRKKFPNSYFLDELYDDGIIGVDCITQSVIYDFILSGWYLVIRHEGTYGDLGDRMYGGDRIMSMIEYLTPEILQGKVKPTISMYYPNDITEWDDMRIGTCSFRPELQVNK